MSNFDPFLLDLNAAREFFAVMCESEAVTFQTFDDSPAKRPHLANILHGDIDQRAEQLCELNSQGAGIFWMVNYGDGKGRRRENVTAVRALFVDLDGAPLAPILSAPAEPHAVIESSKGRYHAYWLVDGCPLEQFRPAQLALARKYGADQSVNDPPRVMRVPGFVHAKGQPYTSRIISTSQHLPYKVDALLKALDIDVDQAEDKPAPPLTAGPKAVPEGGRNVYLTRVIGKLNSLGLHPAAIREAIVAENQQACSPPLPDGELHGLISECLRRYVLEHGQAPVIAFGTGGMPASGVFPVLDIPALRSACQSASWLVKGIIPDAALGMLFGGSGTFKSFLALDLAMHVAHGRHWLGRKTRSGPVVYVAAEGGAGIWRRVQAWHKRHGTSIPDALPFYTVPVAVDMLANADIVVEAVRSLRVTPALVVVDTMAQTFSGEENSAGEVGAYLSTLRTAFCVGFGAATLPIHHSGHMATERPRGSSALRANIDYMMGCHRDEKEMIATMSCTKQKDGEEFEDISFSMTSHEVGFDSDGDPITSLCASAVMTEQEKQTIVMLEIQKGRSGRNAEILTLAHSGMHEDELRRAFYANMDGNAEAKSKAYRRAKQWATGAGLMDFAEGRVIMLKTV